jgi:ribosomal protein L37AE/L43A
MEILERIERMKEKVAKILKRNARAYNCSICGVITKKRFMLLLLPNELK